MKANKGKVHKRNLEHLKYDSSCVSLALLKISSVLDCHERSAMMQVHCSRCCAPSVHTKTCGATPGALKRHIGQRSSFGLGSGRRGEVLCCAASKPWLPKDGRLVLADGTVLAGRCFGAPGTSVAEVVFNTSMSGYQEIMTDPSYRDQMVCFTHPHIGNVGINDGTSSAIYYNKVMLLCTNTKS